MSKRLTKALLRLCELEKKALETDVDFWKQEVKLTNKAFKEIEETNRQLQDQVAKARFERDLDRVKIQGLAGQNEQLQSMATHAMAEDASLRDRISTAKFERDQARVELKGLAEENERLRKNTGWVRVRDWFWAGQGRTVGLLFDGSISLVELCDSQWYAQIDSSPKTCDPPVYLYELPEPPIQNQVEETDAKSEHPDAEIKLALESA